MAVREIHPVMDRVTRYDADFNPTSDLIVFVVIRELFGSRPQRDEMIDQSHSGLSWQGVQKRNRLDIDQQPINHALRLFRVPLPQIINIHPMRRVLVVNFLRQRLPEVFVSNSLLGNEECNQLPLLHSR